MNSGARSRAFWRELPALLPADLAAVLPGARAALFPGAHGEDRSAGVHADGAGIREFGGGFGPVDCRGAERVFCAKRDDRSGASDRRSFVGGMRGSEDGPCRGLPAGGERVVWAELVERMADYADAGGAASFGTMDWVAEFSGESGGCGGAGGDGIRCGPHRKIPVGIRDHRRDFDSRRSELGVFAGQG